MVSPLIPVPLPTLSGKSKNPSKAKESPLS